MRVVRRRASTLFLLHLNSIIDYSLPERGWSIYWSHVWWRYTLPVESLPTAG